MPFLEPEGVAGEARVDVPPAKSPPAPAYLLDLASPIAYALGGRPVGIGRDPVNYITLPEATTSRFHAEVRQDDRAHTFTFHSMGARGSIVNGAPVTEGGVTLAEGDVIAIGGTSLRFTALGPPVSYQVVARSDQSPTSRSAATPPVHRRVEPPTPGGPPAQRPRPPRARKALIIGLAAIAAAVILIVSYLRGRHPA
jgi:hypothetical protein